MVTPQFEAAARRATAALHDCYRKSARVTLLALAVESRVEAMVEDNSEANMRAAAQAITEACQGAADVNEAWEVLASALDAWARVARAKGGQ